MSQAAIAFVRFLLLLVCAASVAYSADGPAFTPLARATERQSESVSLDIVQFGLDSVTVQITFQTADGGTFYNVDAHPARPRQPAHLWLFTNSGEFVCDLLYRPYGSNFGPSRNDWQTLAADSKLARTEKVSLASSMWRFDPIKPGTYKLQYVYSDVLYAPDCAVQQAPRALRPAVWSDLISIAFAEGKGWYRP